MVWLGAFARRGRERLIIGLHGRLAVENIKRDYLRSRGADPFQTSRRQRARPREAPQPRQDPDPGTRAFPCLIQTKALPFRRLHARLLFGAPTFKDTASVARLR